MFEPQDYSSRLGLRLELERENMAVIGIPKEKLSSVLDELFSKWDFVFLTSVVSLGDGRMLCWLERAETGFSLGLALEESERTSSCLHRYYKNIYFLENPPLDRDLFEGTLEQSVEASEVIERSRHSFWLKEPFNPAGELQVGAEIFDGKITTCRFATGRYHRGFEAKLAGKTMEQAADAMLKFDGGDGVFWNLLFYRGIELANDINVTEKAQAARMIFMELSRVAAHLEFCANIAFEMESLAWRHRFLALARRARAILDEDFEIPNPQGVFILGGLGIEPPSTWVSSGLKEVAKLKTLAQKFIDKVSSSLLWGQTKSVGRVAAKELLSWGVSGPDLRACGVNFDLRKRKPFYFYEDVDFSIALGIEGALFDRIMARLREAKESLGIVEQLLDNFPTGALADEDALEKAQCQEESMFRECFETSSGLGSVYTVCREGAVVQTRIETNGFAKMRCLEELVRGRTWEEAPLWLKSMQLNFKTMEK